MDPVVTRHQSRRLTQWAERFENQTRRARAGLIVQKKEEQQPKARFQNCNRSRVTESVTVTSSIIPFDPEHSESEGTALARKQISTWV